MRGIDWINLILPDELILEILEHLHSKSSRDACSLVCKRWLALERLSRDTIRIGASGATDGLIKLLATRFINIRNLFIDERLAIAHPDERNWGNMAMLELGEGCPLLKDIVLSHYRQITDAGLAHLVKRCSLLETCHMVYCPGYYCKWGCHCGFKLGQNEENSGGEVEGFSED